MKIAVAALLTWSNANATSLANLDYPCSLITRTELALVGKVIGPGGRVVVVEEAIRGPVREPGSVYNVDKPDPLRHGGRYLLFADQRLGFLRIIHAWDMADLDTSVVKALGLVGKESTLVGSVRFQGGGPAGALVPVNALGPGGKRLQTVTQPGGWFRFHGIAPGDYRLSLGEARLDAPSAPVSVHDPTARVPEQGCTIQTVLAWPNGWIEGIVSNADGSPVPHARVHAQTGGQTREANADAEGRYRLRGLPQGSYRLVYGGSPVVVDLNDREGRTGVNLRIPPKIEHEHLTIELVDSNGEPLHGAEVLLHSPLLAQVRTFLLSGNLLSVRLERGEFYSVTARLWRDGRLLAGNSGSIRLETGGIRVRVSLN